MSLQISERQPGDHAGDGPAQREDEREDAAAANAHELRDLGVLGDGPNLHTAGGPVEDCLQEQEDDDADGDRDELEHAD